MGNLRQEYLCKFCASLHRVQMLCKLKRLAGICANSVQGFRLAGRGCTIASYSDAPAGSVARRQGRLEIFKGFFLRPIPSKVELHSWQPLCVNFSLKFYTMPPARNPPSRVNLPCWQSACDNFLAIHKTMEFAPALFLLTPGHSPAKPSGLRKGFEL